MRGAFLHDGLEYWRRRAPERLAVEMDLTDRLTYAALGDWSDRVAAHLRGLGVRPGDRVVVNGANAMAFVVAAFAILKAGAVIVPLNERFTAPEIEHFVRFSEAAAVIADTPRRTTIEGLGLGLPLIDFAAIDALRDGGPPDFIAPNLADDALAMIVFTSGSTGRPKGVMLSHADHLGRYWEMCRLAPELGPETRSMMPMGIQGAPGMAWGALFTSAIGGSFFFNGRYTPELTLRTLVERRIGFFNAVPIVYKDVAKLPAFADADLSALGFARCGGARLPREAWDAWNARGVAIRTLYGQSEYGGGALIATAEEARAKPESCGRGMPSTKVRILRADGGDCAPDEPGRVLLRGPGMMAGYWRDEAATAATIVDGWLDTGDIGVRDADGDFFFVDRARELVKCGGFNVSPQEIENVLLDCPAVDEAAIFAVADERYGEVPFALVVRREDVAARELFDHCRGRLANFKLPRYIVFHDDPLPRLARGKVDKVTLRQRYADAERRFAKLA